MEEKDLKDGEHYWLRRRRLGVPEGALLVGRFIARQGSFDYPGFAVVGSTIVDHIDEYLAVAGPITPPENDRDPEQEEKFQDRERRIALAKEKVIEAALEWWNATLANRPFSLPDGRARLYTAETCLMKATEELWRLKEQMSRRR